MRFSIYILFATVLFGASDAAYNGRWDISVPNEPRVRAWWLEIEGAGTAAAKGKFVGAPGGQLDPVSSIKIENGELIFVVKDGTYRARLEGDKLKGSYRDLSFTGVRAPEIKDKDGSAWQPGTPVELFNGKDLNGWHSRVPGRELAWKVADGMLNNGDAKVPDIVSDGEFWNFTLHVEFRIGKGSNSGVGLRGRYEIQIFDDYGQPPSLHGNGALYSRIAPAVNASRPPGEWQTFDIRLVGRTLTVVVNDKKVIDHAGIEGLTAMANNPDEAKPGPIILQGDHGPVEFRKIVLTPLPKR